ncbi:MAG: gephyrin-like molybdotransferase Glp [Pseudomonadota bacterium]
MADGPLSPMLAYEDAVARILEATPVTDRETIPLDKAARRILAAKVSASVDQPPHAVSSMDGYAISLSEADRDPNQRFAVVGEVAAGDPPGTVIVGPGQAARIFTGAPIPAGADSVVIQENTTSHRDGTITFEGPVVGGSHIRPKAYDFSKDQEVIEVDTELRSAHLSLLAAAGHSEVCVVRKPRVAIISTGNELVAPGNKPMPGQIIASNAVGIGALVEKFGGEPINFGIARDDLEALTTAFISANEQKADIIVTLGGASVGDHDLVCPALENIGAVLDFWKVAVRPGKPLMFGQLRGARILGLPGNPVSSLVCAHIFLQPLLKRLLGQPAVVAMNIGVLDQPLPGNGPRRHFMRAMIVGVKDGLTLVRPLMDQDSSLLTNLSCADVLISVSPHHGEMCAGARCEYLTLE